MIDCIASNVPLVHILGNGVRPKIRPMARDDELAELRRANIWRLVESRFQGKRVAMALATGRSPSQIGHWLSGIRNSNGDTCRDVEEKLGLPKGSLDIDPADIPKVEEQGTPYMAHGLSHQPEQTPTLTREKLMSGVEVKGEFWVELWDDAIGQELPRGTLTLWDAGLQPEVGDFVLIRTADGRPHVRVYGESLAHGWQGKPLHSDYEPIPGAGAKVLAVFVSAKVRRSQLRR